MGRGPVEAVGELFPHVPPQMLERLLRTIADAVGATPEITDTVGKLTGTTASPFHPLGPRARRGLRRTGVTLRA
ncbi:hypothetical protein BIV23_22655 [Streptomyces monashensis]|uniref:Uncharacterized protein n=1 Tax=Streptomyces monashensis TaxID=1678012 RepID=A0A1S2QD31_9ACTN|nr:hypothetical protein BIV23_22655 [Streptomyces monashensis]